MRFDDQHDSPDVIDRRGEPVTSRVGRGVLLSHTDAAPYPLWVDHSSHRRRLLWMDAILWWRCRAELAPQAGVAEQRAPKPRPSSPTSYRSCSTTRKTCGLANSRRAASNIDAPNWCCSPMRPRPVAAMGRRRRGLLLPGRRARVHRSRFLCHSSDASGHAVILRRRT